MTNFFQPLAWLLLFAFGWLGCEGKVTQEEAEMSFKEEIALGNLQSPIEVYVFTDWKCIDCRRIEPVLLSASEAIMKDAKLFFIDVTQHQQSLGYTPYNLSFLMNNKPKYFKLRDGLMELSMENRTPEEPQIQALALMYGTKYIPLNYSEITSAQKFFKEVESEFNVDTTPTVVVINAFNERGKKFVGDKEITQSNLINAVKALKEGFNSGSNINTNTKTNDKPDAEAGSIDKPAAAAGG
jgi:hypothetical protein